MSTTAVVPGMFYCRRCGRDQFVCVHVNVGTTTDPAYAARIAARFAIGREFDRGNHDTNDYSVEPGAPEPGPAQITAEILIRRLGADVDARGNRAKDAFIKEVLNEWQKAAKLP